MTSAKAQEIEATAAAYVARHDARALTETEIAEQEAWLASDPSHRTAYLRLWAAWQAADILATAPKAEASEPDMVPMKRSWMMPSMLAAATASVLAVALIFSLQPQRYSTALGARSDYALSDGSRIELNSATKVENHFSAQSRRLDLIEGEAFFEVKHDSETPFMVYTGGYRVTAVGTAFAVRRDQDGLIVAVEQGTVRIDRTDGSDAQLLRAGGVAHVGDSSVVIEQVGAAKVDEVLAWREGFLSFDQTTLADISAEFNRYNATQIHVTGELQSRRMGGVFKTTEVEAFVNVLVRANPQITMTKNADGSIILSEKTSASK